MEIKGKTTCAPVIEDRTGRSSLRDLKEVEAISPFLFGVDLSYHDEPHHSRKAEIASLRSQ